MINLAFLGLGAMGAPMANNLLKKGFSLKAWNRSPKNLNLPIVSSLEEAVLGADIIFSALGDVSDVEEVILGSNGVIKYAYPGSLVVEMSTIGAKAARHVASVLNSFGISFIDAPVSGGDIGAINGTLTIMVGGSQENFARCYPLLEALGQKIYLCGPIGSGQAVKLCNQILVAINMIGVCEAITLAKIQNIDPQLMIEVCEGGAAASWALSNLAPKIPVADYEPGFMIKHILKDLRLIQDTLSQSDVNLPGVDLSQNLFNFVAGLDDGSLQGTQALYRAYCQDEIL